MSTISNIHTAVVYEPKSTKALTGQRLVVTIAKKDAKGNYGPHLQQTMATSIPVLTTLAVTDFEALSVREAATEYFKTIQNQMINERIKSGNKTITTEDLHISKIIDFINADATGDTWTSERIAGWFTDNIAANLGIRMIEAGKTDEAMEVALVKTCRQFAERMESKARFTETDKAYFNKILDFTEDKTTAMYKRWDEKINGAKKAVEVIQDNLGF